MQPGLWKIACILCSAAHLAWPFGKRFSSWWCCLLPQPSSCMGFLLWMLCSGYTGQVRQLWFIATAALTHSIWTFRNKLLFEHMDWEENTVFSKAVTVSFSWTVAKCNLTESSFTIWIASPISVVIGLRIDEAAMNVLSTRSIEEAMSIFTQGLQPVVSVGKSDNMGTMMDLSKKMEYLEEELQLQGIRDIASAPF
ncbi:hypothetical protein REPUB_Repub09cG0099800 [Reevesia pubescens]